jgi:DNA-binding MarR family transcriptional regulator
VTDVARISCDLRVALARVVRRLRQSHEQGELTLSELSVLSRLDRDGPAAPGSLAESERVKPQAMGNTLAALEQREYVARTPDPQDGRRVLMSATEGGRALLAGRRSHVAKRMAAALAEEFTPAEQRQLADVVPLLERLAERV